MHVDSRTFDNVTVTPGTPTPPVAPPSAPPLPDGWLHHDIGSVGFTGDTIVRRRVEHVLGQGRRLRRVAARPTRSTLPIDR